MGGERVRGNSGFTWGEDEDDGRRKWKENDGRWKEKKRMTFSLTFKGQKPLMVGSTEEKMREKAQEEKSLGFVLFHTWERRYSIRWLLSWTKLASIFYQKKKSI